MVKFFLKVELNKKKVEKKKYKIGKRYFDLRFDNSYFKIEFSHDKKNCFYFDKKFLIIVDGMVLGDKEKRILSSRELLSLFIVKGKNFFKNLNGYYSLIIFNFENNEIFFGRDHAGIRNLYYTKEKNFIKISNQIELFYILNEKKFLLNERKYFEHIVHGNIVGGETLHKNLFEIPAGYYASLKKKKIILTQHYNYVARTDKETTKNKIKKFEKIFTQVIKEWLPKNKFVAILLSGGVDSSLVTSFIDKRINKLNLFTASFDKKLNYNETKLITNSKLDLKKKHTYVKITQKNLSSNLIRFIHKTYLPITNFNGIVVDILSKKIKKLQKTKTIFTGEGSDEIFSGFDRYYELSEKFITHKNSNSLIMSKNFFNIKRFKFINKNFKYSIPKTRKVVLNKIRVKSSIKKYLLMDQITFLPSYMDRLSQCSYINEVDLRPVFMDKRIINFAHSLNKKEFNKVIKNSVITKSFLREFASKYLPEEICYPKSKKAQLMTPSSNWFHSGIYRKLFLKYVNKYSYFSKIMNLKKLMTLLKNQVPHRQVKNDHSSFFERILSFEIWYKFMKRYE